MKPTSSQLVDWRTSPFSCTLRSTVAPWRHDP